MRQRKKIFFILFVMVILVLAAVFFICFLPGRTSDWIAELGYRDEEVYPLAFHGAGGRSCPEIPVHIGEETFPIIFDTGCGSGFTVTTELQDTIAYTALGRTEALNRDGSHRGWSERIRIDALSVCGTSFAEIETNMIDWRMTSSHRYDGLIGLAYFQDRTVTLDYRSKQAAVSDRPIDYEALGPDYIVLPLLHAEEAGQRYLPFFEAEYRGQPICVYLDTGKNYSYLHDPEGPSMGRRPEARYEAVIAVGEMELTLRDMAKAGLAQAEGLPYPTAIELNSDQIWAHDLIITFDLIDQKILFRRQRVQ